MKIKFDKILDDLREKDQIDIYEDDVLVGPTSILNVSSPLSVTQVGSVTNLELTSPIIILQGDWNASTNTPDITGTTVPGHAWLVSVAGSTDLGGITDWEVGDLAVKTASSWIKVDNTEVDNFSYNEIYKNVTVPIHQQMVVVGDIDNSHGYTLDIQGEVVTENRDYLLDLHAESIADLSDVTHSGLADDKILMWHTNRWQPTSITYFEPSIDHNNLLNYIGSEHINWTNATENFLTTGTITGSNLSGINTGDQDLSNYINLRGTWNASTNSPDITGTTTTGYMWEVNASGSTSLGGITDWQIGDFAVKTSTTWAKIDNSEASVTWGSITGSLSNQTDLQNALNAKVPYTGATGDVNLGDYSITVDAVSFDLTPIESSAIGRLTWNSTDETLDLGLNSEVTLQIGQETLVRVVNKTGSAIANGTPVYISGSQGNRPTIAKARADINVTSHGVGITTQQFDNNEQGFITVRGLVRGIKTDYTGTGSWGTTWNEGDSLWISKTDVGVLTNVEPSAPHYSDLVGVVTNVHQNQGSILVQGSHHKTMADLSDVNGTALTTTGQFAVWNNTAGYFDFNINVSTDGTLASNSDSKVPTEKAVKTYVDSFDTEKHTATITTNSDTVPKITSILNDSLTFTFSRDGYGKWSSITDGTRTWTITRTANGKKISVIS